MIRNVVVGRLREHEEPQQQAAAQAQLDAGLAGIASLRLPGLLANHLGRDAGLRAGGWTFAITNDWVDVDAYRGYDQDPEHGRYRAMIGGVCAEVVRVQFVLPG